MSGIYEGGSRARGDAGVRRDIVCGFAKVETQFQTLIHYGTNSGRHIAFEIMGLEQGPSTDRRTALTVLVVLRGKLSAYDKLNHILSLP
jgi:hypothetical protein